MTENTYDVALSFAGEDRAYVEMVADGLKAAGITVFYDRYEQANLWGKDLYEHLTTVYRDTAQYTVLFISKHYKEKLWTRHERRAAQARAFMGNREYLLPARFDDTSIEGILETTGYIDLRQHSPAQVCGLLSEKLGRPVLTHKADNVPSPRSPATSGIVAFDHTSHNGVLRLGEGQLLFETRWSPASSTSVHCYNDMPSVRGVALAPRDQKPHEIHSARSLDFTSRVRTPEEGRVVVLENAQGFFAAIQILTVLEESADGQNSLQLSYWILPDGSDDFTAIEAGEGSLPNAQPRAPADA